MHLCDGHWKNPCASFVSCSGLKGCAALTSKSRRVRPRQYDVTGYLGKTVLVELPCWRRGKCFFMIPGILEVAGEKGTVQYTASL